MEQGEGFGLDDVGTVAGGFLEQCGFVLDVLANG
jgi:hypothetical protein